MNERRKNGGFDDLSNDELAGFVRLLLGGKQLPKETPDIIAYLESVSRRTSQTKPPGQKEPRSAKTVAERLREVHPRPIRAFCTHLLATRIVAGCRVEEVCHFLDERPDLLRGIENRSVDPLDLKIPTLAKLTAVFGFSPEELRESLVLELCHETEIHAGGDPFARSNEKDFRTEMLQIASDDLLRAAHGRAPRSRLKKEALARIEMIVQGVTELLKA